VLRGRAVCHVCPPITLAAQVSRMKLREEQQALGGKLRAKMVAVAAEKCPHLHLHVDELVGPSSQTDGRANLLVGSVPRSKVVWWIGRRAIADSAFTLGTRAVPGSLRRVVVDRPGEIPLSFVGWFGTGRTTAQDAGRDAISCDRQCLSSLFSRVQSLPWPSLRDLWTGPCCF
jgi:hypothetical protein